MPVKINNANLAKKEVKVNEKIKVSVAAVPVAAESIVYKLAFKLGSSKGNPKEE